ncbi:MAG: hypothetical protein ACPG77_03510, partial [Nannocystaceae bacterium]
FAKSCRMFWDSMLDAKNQILIAAPTLAEVLRGNPKTKIPSTRSIRVIPFDRKAAELLGHKLPVTLTKTAAKESGFSHTYFKYDAMIVACAKRWGAEVIIALDSDHASLAGHVGLAVKAPAFFEDAQTTLELLGE